jgi:hypothetical protein
MTFVLDPLYPKENNDSKDEGLWYLTFYVALFLIHSIWEQVSNTNKSVVPDVDKPTSKDLIDEDRVFALQALDKYQVQTKVWRDKAAVPREINEGDLVLIRTTRTESQGKLETKWEGPFIVKMKASPSAYRLATSSGEDLEHSWNIDNLQKIFV